MKISDFEKNVLLGQFTSFKIGGPATYFYRAKTAESALEAIVCARGEGIMYTVISGGSNILVSDKGFDGLIVKMENDTIMIDGVKVIAGAGLSMAVMAQKTVEVGLTGFEWAIGVPGKIGGSVYGNAGCFGRDISLNLKRVRVLYEQDDAVWMDHEMCQFGYRDSLFKKHPEWVILDAEFEFEIGDSEKGRKKLIEYSAYRKEKQPQGVQTAGSFFKNPDISETPPVLLQDAQAAGVIRNNTIPAGWIIDRAGLLGKRIGNVGISEKHGNFFVNYGAGTAEEIIMLASFIKQQTWDKFGVQLHEEVQYIGF